MPEPDRQPDLDRVAEEQRKLLEKAEKERPRDPKKES